MTETQEELLNSLYECLNDISRGAARPISFDKYPMMIEDNEMEDAKVLEEIGKIRFIDDENIIIIQEMN